MNYINSVIDTAYLRYNLIQHPTEYLNFCEFYRELKCRNILEIGSYFGGNFYVLCKLSDPIGLKIAIDCPDYQNKDVQIKLYSSYLRMKTFGENVHVLNTDSHFDETRNRVSDILQNQKLDFIFIDGDHSYEGVKKDFEMYSPFINPGGYIAFHDINQIDHPDSNKYGVNRFWKELNYENKFEFNSKSFFMGIGVIKVL